MGATWQRVQSTGLLLLLLVPLGPAARAYESAASQATERGQSQPSAPRPHVTAFSGGLLLTWQAGPPDFEWSEGGLRASLPGWPSQRLPGAPLVPLSTALVALPPGAQPWLEVVSVDETPLALPAPLARAPAAQSGAPADAALSMAAPPSAAVQAAQPAAPLELGGQPVRFERLGRVRGVELARVVFYPLLPAGSALRHFRQVSARLHFFASTSQDAPQVSAAPNLGSDPILQMLAERVLNPGDIQAVPAGEPPLSQDAGGSRRLQGEATTRLTDYATSHPWQGEVFAFEIDRPGLVAISYSDLAAAGANPAALTPANLQVSRGSELLAADWQGDADAAFEPGERLLVAAQPRFSRFSSAETFYVWQSAQPALRSAPRSVAPGGQPLAPAWVDLTFEQNQIYTPNCYCAPLPAGRDGDRWVWQRLALPDHASASVPFQVSSLDPAQPGRLTVWAIGFTDVAGAPDHRLAVTLNGAALGEQKWDGKQAVQIEYDLPPGLLKPGQNELNLNLPGLPGVTVEGAWLDAYTLRAALGSQPVSAVLFEDEGGPRRHTLTLTTTAGLHLYDVTDPLAPQRLVDWQLSGATLTFGEAGAAARRYLAVVESALLAPANLRPVADLQTGGLAGADYLVIAPAEFQPALQPLLDLRQAQGLRVAVESPQAIYDHFGQGQPDPQAIYTFLTETYARWSPRPLYVLLVGDGSADPRNYATSEPDPIPAFLAEVDPWAGETAADNRYAAVDGADLLPDLLVGRLPVNSLAETQAVVAKLVNANAVAAWQNTAVFVADNADTAGNFMGTAQAISQAYFLPPWIRERLYYIPNATSPEDLRADLLDAWRSGAAFMQYSGHASIHQWASERFLHIDDVPNLGNAARLPVLLELTCFTGAFHTPGLPALDETLLRQADGGALAVWGATGLGLASGQVELADGFVQALSQGSSLGQAALAGKLKLLEQQNTFLDLVDTYTLFGDPAVLPTWGVKATIFLPVIGRSVASD